MSEREEVRSKSNEREPEKTRPSHRVSFARIRGRDENGQDVLGPARQIGAIWPRRTGEGRGILRFDLTPKEMEADRGVVFVDPIDDKKAAGRKRARDAGRDDNGFDERGDDEFERDER